MTSHPVTRRTLLLAAAATALPALGAPSVQGEVWKSPSCGCCKDWIAHMQGAGFALSVHETGNTAVRARLKVPAELGSCHTALIGGYAIEGHVPARDVQRLLKERPQAVGLTVPGMPIGAPGMDGPEYGGQRDRYDVLLVLADGRTRVFSSYR